MPLTIDLPPDVLAALRGRAAARNRTPEEEAAVAVAASLDVLLHPPEPPAAPHEDWRDDPEAVAWVESVRATAPPLPPAPPGESLQEYLRRTPGVESSMSPGEWSAYWETLERDGEGRPDVEPDAGGSVSNAGRAAA